MDERLDYTIRYAKEELEEIERFRREGKLNDSGVFIRLFTLGKLLVGWDDDVPKNEAMEQFLQTYNTVEAMIADARRAAAS